SAHASEIIYNFHVSLTAGPSSGQTLNGSFSFDSALLSGPNLDDLNGLHLQSFDLSFAGHTFNTSDSDAWILSFSNGQLTDFRIGAFVTALNQIFDLANAPDFYIADNMFTGYDPVSKTLSTGGVVLDPPLVSGVPEPSTALMLVAGLIAAGLRRRRG